MKKFSALIALTLVLNQAITASPTPWKGSIFARSGPKNLTNQAAVNAVFDYVVVGGGTAGLVMAARLSENSMISVAVVEAGGFYEQDPTTSLLQIPLYDTLWTGKDPKDTNPAVDWGFVTTPQQVCSAVMNDKAFAENYCPGCAKRAYSLRSRKVPWGKQCSELHGLLEKYKRCL